MRGPRYLSGIFALILAAILIRLYGPTNCGFAITSNGGLQGYPANIVAFWFLIVMAIVTTLVYFVRKGQVAL